MSRYSKIICTLGPASSSEEMIVKMAQRGMDVARINSSHGNHEQHQEMIDLIRRVNEKHHFNVKILQDLEGYRMRLGRFKKSKMLLNKQIWWLTMADDLGDDHIPFDFEEDLKIIKNGMQVFIDDGKIQLKVLSSSSKKVKLRVIQGGELKQRKGINIPDLKLKANIMTDKDALDLEFAIRNNIDMIAQSFVRNKKDIQRVMEIVKPVLPNCKVIAKIENREGVNHVESIIEACDGIMVARGDLGVSMPIFKIPILQKYMISLCNRNKKISITATQMLDSMIEEGRPTRAEVTDVANAIIDGTDYAMLSGETAVGKYPSRCIKLMGQIIEYAESYKYTRPALVRNKND